MLGLVTLILQPWNSWLIAPDQLLCIWIPKRFGKADLLLNVACTLQLIGHGAPYPKKLNFGALEPYYLMPILTLQVGFCLFMNYEL